MIASSRQQAAMAQNLTSQANLTSNKIKIGLYISPPDVYPCALKSLNSTQRCETPGLVSEFLASCLQKARLNYEIASVGSHLGSYSDEESRWTGLFGELENGTIDTIATFASYSKIRADSFLYTRFFDSQKYVFLIKLENLKISQGALVLIHGFSAELWFAIMLTLATLLVCLAFQKWTFLTARRCYDVQNRRGNCFGKVISLLKIIFHTFWNLIRFSLGQSDGNPFQTRGISANALFIYLSLFTVVFLNLYQNVVYNQINTVARRPPFRSTHELVNLISTGQLTLLTNSPDIAYFDWVNNSDSEHFRLVRRALRRNPLQMTRSSDEAMEKLNSHDGYVYVCLRYAAMRLAYNHCDVVIVDVDTPTMWNGFILNKNQTRLARRLDRAAFQVLGHLDFLHQQLNKKFWRSCRTEGVTPLTLGTLGGVFVLFTCALAVAVIALVMEAIAWLRLKRAEKN